MIVSKLQVPSAMFRDNNIVVVGAGAGGLALPDARALTAYCRRHLALHKVPVNFTFVAALLTTASGKRVRDPARLTAHGEVAA